jgi:hypothetical protein
MTQAQITISDIQQTIKRVLNWKAAGPDGIQNFWWKKFTSVHRILASQFNQMLKNPNRMPEFLTQGITYLKPKNNQTADPKNYRPIACLPTLYKILTSVITNKISTHLSISNILTEEQKGCRKNSQGCKEQLLIDAVVIGQAKHKFFLFVSQKNISVAWMDYKKAFDSV